MFNRLLEYCIVTVWLISMTWLVARDVVPRWYAQSPPQSATIAWLEEHGRQFQYGVFGEDGIRRGTAWTTYSVHEYAITRNDILALENFQPFGDIFLESEVVFLNETELEDLTLTIHGLPTAVELTGERQGPKFVLQLKIGTRPAQVFVLEAEDAQTFCDSIKPFSALQGLQVGQSWKIHVLDPISLIQGKKAKFKPTVVSVVGRESILLQGRRWECFVVESLGARAWVDDSGRVLVQKVDIPGLGQLVIREQPFQRSWLDNVKRRINRARLL